MTETKRCPSCGESKQVDQFYRHLTGKLAGKTSAYCRSCTRQRQSDYYRDRGGADRQREYIKTPAGKAKSKRGNAKDLARVRADARAHLGGVCQRCGFSDDRALQIDHVHGGGRKERSSSSAGMLYRRVIASVPGETYQLLCANCNWIKRHENQEWVASSPVN